jgi:hypothetical protein
MAESLTVSKRFECLDAGQLLKHILGLTRTFGQRRFILLYLWYEVEGIHIATGTIVDATIIHAPSSTKNQSGKRDPEMHQTRKGRQWCVSRTRAKARDAVPKMGDGLPESAYRSRLQTARCRCV